MSAPTSAPLPPPPSALLGRWLRLQLQVRCALEPSRPALIGRYLACGTLLTRRGALPAATAQQRMLSTLLQTAGDAALPTAWRGACLDCTAEPLARLSALLRLHDPPAWAAWDAAVQMARDRMAAPLAGAAMRRPAG